MTRFHLPPEWRLPDTFTRRLGDSAGRQRAMFAERHLLLVLHEPPRVGEPARQGRPFWREPDGTWHSRTLGDGPQALKRHVAEFADRLAELEELWQTARSAAEYFALLQAIAPLHRTTRNLHATLQEARTMVPEDRDLINLRDQVGEVERAIELLHGDARNGLDFTTAHQAEQQSEQTYAMAVSAYRLNLLVAAFFPVATLGTIFSMNLAHGMERWSTPAHFWVLLGIGLVAGLILARTIARRPAAVAPPVRKRTVRRS